MEWISVENGLPSSGDRVLVTNKMGHMSLSSCTHGRNAHTWSIGTVKYPTHWMPLPAPPRHQEAMMSDIPDFSDPASAMEYAASLEHQLQQEREANARLREAANIQPITDFGQVDEGDGLIFTTGDEFTVITAKAVLNPGLASEEVIYRSKKNHYFITNMVLNGKSHAKNVLVVKALAAKGEG